MTAIAVPHVRARALSLSLHRHFHSAVVHNGSMYVFGGKSNGYMDDLQCFHFGSFSSCAPRTHGEGHVAPQREPVSPPCLLVDSGVWTAIKASAKKQGSPPSKRSAHRHTHNPSRRSHEPLIHHLSPLRCCAEQVWPRCGGLQRANVHLRRLRRLWSQVQRPPRIRLQYPLPPKRVTQVPSFSPLLRPGC